MTKSAALMKSVACSGGRWPYGLVMVILIGWAHRKVETAEDFVVAGRRLGTPLATATLLATWFGAGTLLTAADEVAMAAVRSHARPVGRGAVFAPCRWILCTSLVANEADHTSRGLRAPIWSIQPTGGSPVDDSSVPGLGAANTLPWPIFSNSSWASRHHGSSTGRRWNGLHRIGRDGPSPLPMPFKWS